LPAAESVGGSAREVRKEMPEAHVRTTVIEGAA
jgi:hypothetical protein